MTLIIDWTSVPSHYLYAVQNASGQVWCYRTKPTPPSASDPLTWTGEGRDSGFPVKLEKASPEKGWEHRVYFRNFSSVPAPDMSTVEKIVEATMNGSSHLYAWSAVFNAIYETDPTAFSDRNKTPVEQAVAWIKSRAFPKE